MEKVEAEESKKKPVALDDFLGEGGLSESDDFLPSDIFDDQMMELDTLSDENF